MRTGFGGQRVLIFVRAIFDRTSHVSWLQWVLAALLAVYLFTLGPTGSQVDSIGLGLAKMLGWLSWQFSTAVDAQRAQVADLGKDIIRHVDDLKGAIDAKTLGRGPAPPTPAPPDASAGAPVPSLRRVPATAGLSANPEPIIAEPARPAVPVSVRGRLWRIETSSLPTGKPISVAFGVTAPERRIEALIISRIEVELGNYNVRMTPADGAASDQYVSFEADFSSEPGQSGCHVVKQLALRGRLTAGLRTSGDLLIEPVQQCLNGQPADDVVNGLVSRIASRAAAELVNLPGARL